MFSLLKFSAAQAFSALPAPPNSFSQAQNGIFYTKGFDFMEFKSVINFILGEIPFLIGITLMVYFFWIRPKRKEKRLKNNTNYQTQMGDEILFADGLLGLITKYKDGIVTVESGSSRTKYQVKDDMFLKNLSKEERIKEAYKKMNLWQKILSKI